MSYEVENAANGHLIFAPTHTAIMFKQYNNT